MNLLNFNIGDDFISIIKDGVYVDLHNCFDFLGYNYKVLNKELQLTFKKSVGDWASNEVFNEVVFVFKGVFFLKIQEGESFEFPDDESCLSFIGFNTFDMRHDMTTFLATNEFKSDYDLIFSFEAGHSIKIHSKEVLLQTV